MAITVRREIKIVGDVAYVPLTQGYVLTMDAADVGVAQGYNWTAAVDRRSNGTIRTVYGFRMQSRAIRRQLKDSGKVGCVWLHREILDAPDGVLVDHIDGDGLNCRRENLRLATYAENCRNAQTPSHNRSGVKGVYWHKKSQRWRAKIRDGARQKTLGYFAEIETAKAAYAAAAEKYHGQFGKTS